MVKKYRVGLTEEEQEELFNVNYFCRFGVNYFCR